MFEEGEIALFRKLNMKPVFFGEALAEAKGPTAYLHARLRRPGCPREGLERFRLEGPEELEQN